MSKVDIHKMTEDLYKPFSETGKLLYDARGKNMYFKGKILPDQDKRGIIEGAKALKMMDVFETLLQELEHIACEKIYFTSGDDMKTIEGGKWILWTTDMLRKKVDKLSKLK